MKKYLMGLSLFIFCATSYGETIDLGEKSIYSETGFKNSLRSSYRIFDEMEVLKSKLEKIKN